MRQHCNNTPHIKCVSMPCAANVYDSSLWDEITNRNRRWNWCDKDNFTVCFQLLSHHMIDHCASSWTPHQPHLRHPLWLSLPSLHPTFSPFENASRQLISFLFPQSTWHTCTVAIRASIQGTVRTNVVFFVMQLSVQMNIFQGMCHSCHPPIALFWFVCSSFL